MGGVWTEAYASALIIPEWYLSAMLLCMLFIVPISLLLRKKIKGVFVILVLLGVLGVIAVIAGLCMNWVFTTTFVYDLRAWGEMCVGMFAYYLSTVIAKHEFKRTSAVTLKAIEVVGYSAPIVLGIIPVSSSLMPVCMVVTVIGVFLAIMITFANKGVNITNEKVGKNFAYLGSISLAIYLFHPVIILLLDYTYADCAQWLKMIIVFVSTLAIAAIFTLTVKEIKKAIAKRKPEEKACT